MGAPKPGSTFQPTPAQGGKGGGKPMQPQQPGQVPAQGGKGGTPPPGTYPGMPLTPNPSSPYYFPNGPEPSAQALNQGKGQGVPMGGMLGGGYPPMQPQVQQPIGPGSSGPGAPLAKYAEMERMRAGQPQKPGQVPGQVPAQGGKGTSRQDYDRTMAVTSYGPGGAPSYEQWVQSRLNPKPMPQVMPQKPGVPMQPQVPAQGGKAQLTPEQQATLGNAINTRPMPQVSPPQGGLTPHGPQFANLEDQKIQAYANSIGMVPGQQATPGMLNQMNQYINTMQQQNPNSSFFNPQPTYGQAPPQRPQVLPQKPMPANMAPRQGLAGLQNILYGGKR